VATETIAVTEQMFSNLPRGMHTMADGKAKKMPGKNQRKHGGAGSGNASFQSLWLRQVDI